MNSRGATFLRVCFDAPRKDQITPGRSDGRLGRVFLVDARHLLEGQMDSVTMVLQSNDKCNVARIRGCAPEGTSRNRRQPIVKTLATDFSYFTYLSFEVRKLAENAPLQLQCAPSRRESRANVGTGMVRNQEESTLCQLFLDFLGFQGGISMHR